MGVRTSVDRVISAVTQAGTGALAWGVRATESVVPGVASDSGRLVPAPDAEQVEVERSDGEPIEVRVAGAGPTVVLLHGYGLSAASWNVVAAALVQRGHQVVTFDWRGHGGEATSDAPVKTDVLIDDLVTVLDALDVTDAVLVGHSTGGYVALATLVERPSVRDRFRGLALVSTLAGELLDDTPDGDTSPSVEGMRSGTARRIVRNRSLRLLVSGYVPRVGVSPAVSRELLEEFSRADHAALTTLVSDLATHSYYGRLGDIELEAVVLCGDADRTTPQEHGESIAHELPNARFETVEDAGHLLNWQHPGRIVDAVSSLTAAAARASGEAPLRQAVLVLNPASGTHEADRTEQEIVDRLSLAGVETEVRRTEGEGDARRWANELAAAGEIDLLLVAGGDGTVREGVSGLVEAGGGVTLGVIPMGTANLFARALGVPLEGPAAAAATAAEGHEREVDVIHLVDRDEHAILMVDAGFDARLVRHASRGLKDVLGPFAYIAAGLRNVVGLDESTVVFELDGEQHEVPGHSVLCLNVGRIGDGVVVDETIALDDGLLHVGVVQGDSPWQVLWTAAGLALRQRDAHPNVTWRSGTTLTLDADPALELQIDGDPAGSTPTRLELLAGAITVAVPADRVGG